MTNNYKLLSDIVTYTKYSRYNESEQRRENWQQICNRLQAMHTEQIENRAFGRTKDLLLDKLDTAMSLVEKKKILPSMRSLQFAGDAIKKDNARIYNCSFMQISDVRDFWELPYLLLCGCGVGYSVQQRYTNKLPVRVAMSCHEPETFAIPDSKEGWASAIFHLINAYLVTGVDVQFSYDKIRAAGQELKTSGGKAPGPEALRNALAKIRKVLKSMAAGEKLKPIHVHDIVCYIGDCIVAGGIRRSALICLFDSFDDDMFYCKTGEWWKENPQRAMANNSVVLHHYVAEEDDFKELATKIMQNGYGEPGIFWTWDDSMGTNPCAEIALESNQFCNLVEIAFPSLYDCQRYGTGYFTNLCDSAAFLGTLQATYTNFPKLGYNWKENTENDALIGVGITGLSNTWGADFERSMLTAGAATVRFQNENYARMLGINRALRTTTVKPAGSTSCVLGCSSGVHPYHSKYYLRRVRLDKKLGIYKYLKTHMPGLIEEIDNHSANFCVPIKAPDNAMVRENISAESLFNRVVNLNQWWVREGDTVFAEMGSYYSQLEHNFNNVSCSITYREHEIERLVDSLWENRHNYSSVSMFPEDETVYKRPPHEAITKDQFSAISEFVKSIDFNSIIENDDLIFFESEAACAGGNCEIV